MTVRVAIVAALILVAAGCGDDDDTSAGSGDEADTTETTDATASEDEAEGSVSIAEPESGAVVARRFIVAMEADAVDIEPAGEVRDGAGHFHVMVDTPCLEAGETVPKDDQHIHFGKGQTEGMLFLEAGEHEICLQLADGAHSALPITDEISVTVDDTLPFVTLGVPDGDTVSSPVAVTMEASNFEIQPAGEVRDGAGHFHILVDLGCMGPGETIPKDETHVHFGDGSTDAELELAPGEHTLCLQAGDGAHAALPLVHFLTVVVA